MMGSKTGSNPIKSNDLFHYDIVLIPVHFNGNPWSLATVCPKERSIRYYDSNGFRFTECLQTLKLFMEKAIGPYKRPKITEKYSSF